MHESNHGVGVGQHWRWSWEELKASTKWQGLYPTKMPKIQSGVYWQGDLANLIVEFLTNGQDLCNGDGMHMGPFGINGAGADNGTRLLYIANALQTHGLGVDGLPPSGGSPSPYYIFESEDDVKYYITNEDEACGRGTAYLTENADGTLAYCAVSTDDWWVTMHSHGILSSNLKHVIICCVMPSPASISRSGAVVSGRPRWQSQPDKRAST